VLLSVSLATSLLIAPPAVQRPAERIALSWDAPAVCPDGRALLERIDGFAPGVTTRAREASLRGRVDQTDTGYALALTLVEPGGQTIERSFEAGGCEELANAAALLVAVLLDPVASAKTVAASSKPEPEPKPEPELPPPTPEEAPADREEQAPPPSIVVVDEAPRDPSAPLDLELGLRIFTGGGYGPTTTGTAALGGALALLGERWRVELGAAWIPPRTVRPELGVGGVFDAWFVRAGGCFVPRVGARERIELPLCGAVELGQVRGRGVDELPVVLDAGLPWIALGLGQGLWFRPLRRLAFGLDVEAAVPLRRGSFVVESVEVQNLAPVSVRALAGVELRLFRR